MIPTKLCSCHAVQTASSRLQRPAPLHDHPPSTFTIRFPFKHHSKESGLQTLLQTLDSFERVHQSSKLPLSLCRFLRRNIMAKSKNSGTSRSRLSTTSSQGAPVPAVTTIHAAGESTLSEETSQASRPGPDRKTSTDSLASTAARSTASSATLRQEFHAAAMPRDTDVCAAVDQAPRSSADGFCRTTRNPVRGGPGSAGGAPRCRALSRSHTPSPRLLKNRLLARAQARPQTSEISSRRRPLCMWTPG